MTESQNRGPTPEDIARSPILGYRQNETEAQLLQRVINLLALPSETKFENLGFKAEPKKYRSIALNRAILLRMCIYIIENNKEEHAITYDQLSAFLHRGSFTAQAFLTRNFPDSVTSCIAVNPTRSRIGRLGGLAPRREKKKDKDINSGSS